MPAMVRAVSDERDALLAFLAEQRASLRRSVHGLTDAQCWQAPSASSLSLAGLLRHAAITEDAWTQRITGNIVPSADPGLDASQSGDTVAQLLGKYDEVAAHTISVVSGLEDLEHPLDLSPMHEALPDGVIRTPRWILLHLIEETARHAGHADIIRETLDGATSMQLVLAAGDPLIPEAG